MRDFAGSPSVRFAHARDAPSGKWMTEHLKPNVPVVVAPDIVCALDLPEVERGDEKVFGVVTRKRKSDADMTQLRKLCEKAASHGYAIEHLILATGDVGELDAEEAEALDFPGKTVVRSESLDDLCRAIGRCSALASMKFHGTVVATMYGVPTISLSPTDKNRNFMKMIGQEKYLAGVESPDLPDLFSHEMPPIPDETVAELRDSSAAVMKSLVEALRAATQ